MSLFKKARQIITGEPEAERSYRLAAESQIRHKERAAYFKAKEKERVRFMQGKAKIEQQHALNALKQGYTKKKGSGWGLDIGSMQSGLEVWAGGSKRKKKKSNNPLSMDFGI